MSGERDGLSRFHGEADIFQHRLTWFKGSAVVMVGKCNILELNLASHLIQVLVAKMLLGEFAADDERANPVACEP